MQIRFLKTSGSTTTDEFSPLPRYHPFQMEGKDNPLILVERIDSALYALHGLTRLYLLRRIYAHVFELREMG